MAMMPIGGAETDTRQRCSTGAEQPQPGTDFEGRTRRRPINIIELLLRLDLRSAPRD